MYSQEKKGGVVPAGQEDPEAANLLKK